MAIMLLVVTIFFAMVGMLILSLTVGGIRESADDLRAMNAMTLANNIANSPELRCGSAFGGTEVICIDLDKAMILKENLDLYKIGNENFWGRDLSIRISRLYPIQDEFPCTGLADYPNCQYIDLFEENVNGTRAENFALLCRRAKVGDSFQNKCEIGRISITYKEWNQG